MTVYLPPWPLIGRTVDRTHSHAIARECARIWPAMYPGRTPWAGHCQRDHFHPGHVDGDGWVWCGWCATPLYRARRPAWRCQ
jgi:hypothetical protein